MADAPKLFTLEEANALIPKLENLFTQLQLRYLEVQKILGPIEGEADPDEIERRLQDHPHLRRHFDDIKRLVAAVQETGAIFKGIEIGLADFAFLQGDSMAYLCWQYGEKEIRWWHTAEAGFAGRRPLPGTSGRNDLN